MKVTKDFFSPRLSFSPVTFLQRFYSPPKGGSENRLRVSFFSETRNEFNSGQSKRAHRARFSSWCSNVSPRATSHTFSRSIKATLLSWSFIAMTIVALRRLFTDPWEIVEEAFSIDVATAPTAHFPKVNKSSRKLHLQLVFYVFTQLSKSLHGRLVVGKVPAIFKRPARENVLFNSKT